MSAPNINIPPPVTPALPPVVGRRRNTGLIIGIVVASGFVGGLSRGRGRDCEPTSRRPLGVRRPQR
jgi:hypothetical protein